MSTHYCSCISYPVRGLQHEPSQKEGGSWNQVHIAECLKTDVSGYCLKKIEYFVQENTSFVIRIKNIILNKYACSHC